MRTRASSGSRFLRCFLAATAVLLGRSGPTSAGDVCPQPTWMRVYTTGRQSLTPVPPTGTTLPVGHVVGTSLAPTGEGAHLVATYVGDPGEGPDAGLARIDACGRLVSSREYVVRPTRRAQDPNLWGWRDTPWALVTSLPGRADGVAAALAFEDVVLLLDAEGTAVRGVTVPAFRRFTSMVPTFSGVLLCGTARGVAPVAGGEAVAVLRLGLPYGSPPEVEGAQVFDGLSFVVAGTAAAAPAAVLGPDGATWVGAGLARFARLESSGATVRGWDVLPLAFRCHGDHGEVAWLRYRGLAVAPDGHVLFGGSYALTSRLTPATSEEALVASIAYEDGAPRIAWARVLSENTGYGARARVRSIVAGADAIHLAGSTSHWGQDEGDYDEASFAARFASDGTLAWVTCLGRKRRSGARSEYSDSVARAIVSAADGGCTFAGGTDSYSHPDPGDQTVKEWPVAHPELLVARVGADGRVANVGFGRSPNLGLAPVIGSGDREVDVLSPPLMLQGATVTVKALDAKVEPLTFETRDGTWWERTLPGQRGPAASAPIAKIRLVEPTAAGWWSPTVRFDGTGSSDPEGAGIARYAWAFGDGATSARPTPTHRYAHRGAYAVTLTVTDPQGLAGTVTRTIRVGETWRGSAYPATFDPGTTTGYTVELATGDRGEAGTDATVALSLFGAPGTDGERVGTGDLVLAGGLASPAIGDPFEQGAVETFSVTDAPRVDTVESAVLRIDSGAAKDSWFVDGLTVTNVATGTRQRFVADAWLAGDAGDDVHTYVRLLPVPAYPGGILYDGTPRSDGLTAVTDDVFVLPAGRTAFYVTCLDRNSSVSVYLDSGVLLRRAYGTGAGVARFPYLREIEWGVPIEATELTRPMRLRVRLEGATTREDKVWVFPSAWSAYLREAKAVVLLDGMRGRTEALYGSSELSWRGQTTRWLQGRSDQIVSSALQPVVDYSRDALGLLGAVPDEVIRAELSADMGLYLADRLVEMLSVAGVTLAQAAFAEFAGLASALLSTVDFALQLDVVGKDGGARAGAEQVLSWLPEGNFLPGTAYTPGCPGFRQIMALWEALRVHVDAIVGTATAEGTARRNDPAGTRTALAALRRVAIGSAPTSTTLSEHLIAYGSEVTDRSDLAADDYPLSIWLLLEWAQTQRRASGEEAANWYPTDALDLTTDADKKAETREAMKAYLPILRDVIRISGPLLSAALLD